MFESVQTLMDEHRRVQEELSDPAVHADAARAKRVNRRYAELSRIVAAYDAWIAATDDLETAREFAREDESIAAEIPAMRATANTSPLGTVPSQSRATVSGAHLTKPRAVAERTVGVFSVTSTIRACPTESRCVSSIFGPPSTVP